MDIEAQRSSHIAYKAKLLAELNLSSSVVGARSTKNDTNSKRPTKKRAISLDTKPTRSSARIALSDVKPSYHDDGDKYVIVEVPKRSSKSGTSKPKHAAATATDVRDLNPMPDAEDIRAGWNKWTASGPLPTRDDSGTFHFPDYDDFTPNKSPEEMMREGCFGGSYWRPLKSRKLGILVRDDWQELPTEWHNGLDVSTFLTSPTYNPDINKFKVSCGQSIEEWEAAGWIAYEHDIRGWFQWYCRFFQGRRCDDDDRQVSRWRKCVGVTGRWRRMLLKKYLQMGVRDVFDDGEEEEGKEVSPVMHQTCHHWAYEVKQQDLDDAWNGR